MKQLRKIYSHRQIERQDYFLAEHIASYGEAQKAAAEYRALDLYARVERDDQQKVYYVWTRPGRRVKIRLLPGEVVRRKGLRRSDHLQVKKGGRSA